MAEWTYLEAIREGLRDAMREDPRVYLMGQDIAEYGGAFKLTAGFLEEFGPERVIDTPISEAGAVGMAVGAALLGYRPVVEMQFADFITCGFNEVVNVAAKMYWRTQCPVPLVIRLPYGGGVGAGAFHSQCVEGWFLHAPGLKIVAPSRPRDAYALIRGAVRDPNPVLYCEHKYLYRRIKEVEARETYAEGPFRERIVPWVRIAREGRHVTIIAYGAVLHAALEAAAELEKEGISCEVLDLCVILPLDEEALFRSVRKTSRALIVHEAPKTGGVGAEIAARIAEGAIDALDAPVERLAYPDTPVPFHRTLERACLPSREKIAAVVRRLVRW